MMYVEPEHLRQGIGTTLFFICCLEAMKKGYQNGSSFLCSSYSQSLFKHGPDVVKNVWSVDYADIVVDGKHMHQDEEWKPVLARYNKDLGNPAVRLAFLNLQDWYDNMFLKMVKK